MTASADKTCKLWDEAGNVQKTFKLQDKTVDYMQMGCVYINEQMASISFNGDINLFDADKEQPTTVFRGHMKPISTIAISGDTVVTGSGDTTVLVWDSQTHDPAKSRRAVGKKLHGSIVSGSVIHDGKVYTCSMDDTIACTTLSTGDLTILGKVSGGPNGICFMQNHLVVTTNKGIYVLTLDGEEKSKVATTYTPTCCATNGTVLTVGSKPKVTLYSMKAGKLEQIEEIAEHKVQVTALAWSADGKRFASADSGREIMLWDYDGKVKMLSGPGKMAFHTASVKCLAFSPSGKSLASGSLDTSVMTWEVENLSNRKKELGAHLGGVNCVGWLSEGEVVTGGQVCTTTLAVRPSMAVLYSTFIFFIKIHKYHRTPRSAPTWWLDNVYFRSKN